MKTDMQAPTTVFFDESGWTGADYTNDEQPLFVIGCHWFSQNSCEELEKVIHAKFHGNEPKFSKLIKTNSGQTLLEDTIRLLTTKFTASEGFSAYVVHKKSALVRKFVLDCIEPVLHDARIDMFKDGLSVSYANLISTTLPVFLGKDWYRSFLDFFNRLIRSKKEDDNIALYNHCRYAVRNKDAYDILSPYLARPVMALKEIRSPEYRTDCYASIISGLLTHLHSSFGLSKLNLVLDQTKATSNPELNLFATSLQKATTSVRISDCCSILPGLEVTSVVMSDSRSVIGIKIADIIAGLFSWCFRNEENLDSTVGKALMLNLRDEHMIHMINSNQITPESLGMKDSELHLWIDSFQNA
jgi:hypothetical protein